MNRKLVFIISLLVSSLCMLPTRLGPIVIKASNGYPVHNLNTGLNYTKIQEAIDANETRDGHTIFVETGTYYENVVVNKTLSLVGEDSSTTVIDGGGIGDVVYVTAWNVAIKNFQIRKSGSYYAPPNSGIRMEANYCNITDNNIIDNSVGVYLYESSHNNICSNNVTNKYEGITLHDSSNNVIFRNEITAHEYIGVALSWLSSGNTISDNNIETNGRGISCADSSHNFISGNNITAIGDTGLELYQSSNNRIVLNNITNNDHYGIYLYESSNNTISGNYIADTYGYTDSKGVVLMCSSNNVIDGNIVKKNDYGGIVLAGSSNNIISANDVTDNDNWGIDLTYCSTWEGCYPTSYSDNNTIIENNVTRNTHGIRLRASWYNTLNANTVTNNSGKGIHMETAS